jgi:hypothetical protein
MASNIKPDAVASQPGGVASKPAVYVQAFDTGIRGFAYEFKAPCGCRHWSTGKFEYCPGHHAAATSHAALVQALRRVIMPVCCCLPTMPPCPNCDARVALKLAGEEI